MPTLCCLVSSILTQTSVQYVTSASHMVCRVLSWAMMVPAKQQLALKACRPTLSSSRTPLGLHDR